MMENEPADFWYHITGGRRAVKNNTADTKLSEYRKKREFETTPEPGGGTEKTGAERTFVIQEHDASHLHYDLRLEIDGVLVSWAVPKEPSSDPGKKRLAVRTEDHPLEYADFEGTIPEGHYGAGTVTIWDRGTYENRREVNMEDSLSEGKIEIRLHGRKLKGGYNLIRTKWKGNSENWLLIKSRNG